MKKFKVSFLTFYRNGDLLGSNPWDSVQNYNLLNAEKVIFHCDSCPEAKTALKEIFGEAQYTDTLISPQSYVKLYMRYYHSNLLDFNRNVPDIPSLKKQMINEGIAKEGVSNKSVWAYFAKKHEIQVHKTMHKFSHAVYTLPNFSSVCRGFNVGRFKKTKDNFIVALYHMYNYYQKKEIGMTNPDLGYPLAKFLSETNYLTQDEVVRDVQMWLDNYSNFAQFVEKYYLQDFLEDPDNSHSKPKELWEGIFHRKLLPSKEEFITSINFLTNAIESRGNRMSANYPGEI
jgi:hypothetical protein